MSSGSTPWWRHRQRERFARAVDSSPGAVQPQDPTLAGELAVVARLQHTAEATGPGDAARDRMRAKLFEQFQPPTPAPALRPSPVPRKPAPTPGITNRTVIPAPAKKVTSTRGRVLIALGATFCLVLALAGMTLLLSRNALPGDALYSIRRAAESATLGLTSGDDSKGRKHLEYAADRIGDIESLAARYPDPADSPVGDYLTAFADFDSDAAAGTQYLTSYATSHSMDGLTTLRDWATQQSGRIEVVESALPAAARTTAGKSVALLGRIATRASALLARDNCYTITSGRTDTLGELPAPGPCDTAPGPGSGEPSHSGGTVGATPTIQTPVPHGATTTPVPTGQAMGPARTTTTFPTPPTVFEPPILGTQQGGGAGGSTPTGAPGNTITIPLPLPGLNLPTLLPGLPGLKIGQ